MFLKKFLKLDPEPGDTGGSVDRGDVIPEDKDLDPDNPDGELPDPKAEEGAEDEVAEEGEEKEPKPKGKDTRIPESRHKAILEKEREKRADLERQLAQYQQGGQIAEVGKEITELENTVLTLEKSYTKLLAEGKLDEAAAEMARIRATERSIGEAKNDLKIQAAEARAVERTRYGVALERIETSFPVLNEDHDDFDPAVMAEVIELKEAYQAKGLTPTVALQKAVRLIVAPRNTKQELATTTTPRVTEKDVTAARKTEAVKKAAEVTGKTPPNLAKVGLDGDKLGGGKLDPRQVMGMSQKEFAGLNEETLSQMRGDTL